MKLGGIVSGLDTYDLINKILQVERQPVTLMKSRQYTFELKKDLWTEVNTSLLALKTANDKLLDINSFKNRTVTTSNDAVVTAAASASAAEATYDIVITNLAQNHQVAGDKKASDWTAGVDGTFKLSDGIYESTINVTAADTLQTIADKINNAKDNTDTSKSLRITASIVDNTLVLSHDESGSANQISFTDDPNKILENIGLVTADGTLTIKNQLKAAEDAIFTVNGINVTRSRNDNLTDVISGITLNLKAENSATITVIKDLNAAYTTVKAFIDQYNSTLDLINTRLSEQKVKEPTSDFDRQKGLLRGDSVMAGVKGRLRKEISDPVDGLSSAYDRLSVIGITTTSDDYGKSGKLQIDETKFKEALAANPDAVIQLFSNTADTDGDGTVEYSEKGVAVRITEELNNLTSSSTTSIGGTVVKVGTILNTIDSIDKIIDGYGDQINAFEERLKLREKALWDQFTALENALSTLNNQASWLTSQLMGLNQ
ncbi:MAG: flagellar filament capping protein FliD [Bacillota bacterium]